MSTYSWENPYFLHKMKWILFVNIQVFLKHPTINLTTCLNITFQSTFSEHRCFITFRWIQYTYTALFIEIYYIINKQEHNMSWYLNL